MYAFWNSYVLYVFVCKNRPPCWALSMNFWHDLWCDTYIRTTTYVHVLSTCSDFESSNSFHYSDSLLVQLEFRTLNQTQAFYRENTPAIFHDWTELVYNVQQHYKNTAVHVKLQYTHPVLCLGTLSKHKTSHSRAVL